MRREIDTEEVASFLLALKHRSVTPEPLDDLRIAPITSCSSASTTKVAYVDKTPASMMEAEEENDDEQSSSNDAIGGPQLSWNQLIGGSELVFAKDRDLVPDALFVAMAQMVPCKLTQADRVGCYKTREIGFIGMCCKHCGGQPGFGRFYPNSVRSMAQTTTSQTITKHIGSKCRFAPPHIRKAVNDLQRQQAEREGMSTGRPRYGSRKIFFQRVWARLHGEPLPEDDSEHDSKKSSCGVVSSSSTAASSSSMMDDASNRTPELDDSRNSSPATSDDEASTSGEGGKPPHHGFYFTATKPTMKRKLASAAGGDYSATKRLRVLPTN